MTEHSCLEESLRVSPIRRDTASALWRNLWADLDDKPMGEPTKLYVDYYSTKCMEFLADGGRHVALRTHSDVVEIAKLIVGGAPRSVITDHISFSKKLIRPDSSTVAECSVDLCASLLLVTDIGEHNFKLSEREFVPWKTGTLEDAIASYFRPQRELSSNNVKIERHFNAQNLTRITGIDIIWTSNLADHLRLTENDKSIFIFHHASFLKFQQRLKKPMLSNELLDETLRTLALLFPQNNKKTRAWLSSKSVQQEVDPLLGKCGSLRSRDRRLERFSTWHDRLVILKQAYDESRPQTISQWWWDRRDGVQWYTFWVAILVFAFTLFFGMIQSIEGAMQVYLSYKSLQA